jgi:hypothetical protein
MMAMDQQKEREKKLRKLSLNITPLASTSRGLESTVGIDSILKRSYVSRLLSMDGAVRHWMALVCCQFEGMSGLVFINQNSLAILQNRIECILGSTPLIRSQFEVMSGGRLIDANVPNQKTVPQSRFGVYPLSKHKPEKDCLRNVPGLRPIKNRERPPIYLEEPRHLIRGKHHCHIAS